MRSTTIEDTSSAENSKQIIVTAAGSSIVNISQKSCELNEMSSDIQEKRDNKFLVGSSNKPEMGIFKTNDTLHESSRSDHVTLLSIGDSSDTQFQPETSDTK